MIGTGRLHETEALRDNIVILGSLACLAALAVSLFFVNNYLGPLLKFTEATLKDLGELNASLDARVRERTADLGAANGKLEESLERLHTAQQLLVEASRRSGRADVATSVLHNVGNALNSVNVSAELLAAGLRSQRLEGFSRAAELLEQNRGRPEFLVEDEKGKQLPLYLRKLASLVLEERSGLLGETEQLTRNIDHIKVIVGQQQAHAAGSGGLFEPLAIPELIEDALRFNGFSYQRHNVEIVREFEEVGKVTTDRHRLFQILMNLLSNAKHAVRDLDGIRRITLRLRRAAEGRVAIDVEDNGCGVPQENLVKIFTMGFTTKPNGHGFGLHSSACAATELGGTLTCASAGPARGARFTLDLPVAWKEGA